MMAEESHLQQQRKLIRYKSNTKCVKPGRFTTQKRQKILDRMEKHP